MPQWKKLFQWSQIIHLTLKGCDMLDHIEENPSLVTDTNFLMWDTDNILICLGCGIPLLGKFGKTFAGVTS